MWGIIPPLGVRMSADEIFGVVAGVFLGNALSIWFFYSIFWGEAQKKRGIEERNLPGWVFIGGSVPPLLVAFFAYMALY